MMMSREARKEWDDLVAGLRAEVAQLTAWLNAPDSPGEWVYRTADGSCYVEDVEQSQLDDPHWVEGLRWYRLPPDAERAQ